MNRFYASHAKRAIDLVVALLLLVSLSPVLLLIAIAVVLDNPGSPLFTQMRVGKDRKEFRIFKFRSMRVVKATDLAGGAHMASAHSEHDPRITAIGRIIRKTSLDELPQIFNIINGTMSLIGPRPIIPAQLAAISADNTDRFMVRPGITGLSQVSGRRGLAWPRQLDLDGEYARNLSFINDIKIAVKTVSVVFTASDVYGSEEGNWRNFIINDSKDKE